jgi:hypothetical protein
LHSFFANRIVFMTARDLNQHRHTLAARDLRQSEHRSLLDLRLRILLDRPADRVLGDARFGR